MKKLTLTFLTCLIFLSPNVVLSDTMDDLVERDGLYYKKFTDVPFTGKISGRWAQGSFKNGKREGPWVFYLYNGQLWENRNYKNGKLEGERVRYWSNGQLWLKGNYKNGKSEGEWVFYYEDGTVNKKDTGTYKDGKKISD